MRKKSTTAQQREGCVITYTQRNIPSDRPFSELYSLKIVFSFHVRYLKFTFFSKLQVKSMKMKKNCTCEIMNNQHNVLHK